MSKTSRVHSEQSKEKISSSLRQLWAKRLKGKRIRERFYTCWVVSVAEAARRGGIDEEELDWNSYGRFKGEIASKRLQRDARRAKEKEMKNIKAKKRGQERAEKMAWVARQKLEHKPKAQKPAKQKGKMSHKGRKVKRELVSEEPSHNDRLIKVNGKNLIHGPSSNQAGVMAHLQSALGSLNIESIIREQRRNAVSLADQIQAARSKRMQIVAGDMQQQQLSLKELNSSNITT